MTKKEKKLAKKMMLDFVDKHLDVLEHFLCLGKNGGWPLRISCIENDPMFFSIVGPCFYLDDEGNLDFDSNRGDVPFVVLAAMYRRLYLETKKALYEI